MIDVKITLMDTSNISFKDLINVIQAIVTTIAILVGGFWSYFLFVKKRQRFPRASISHQIFYRPISGRKALLNINTTLSNSGDVLLSLKSGEVRAQQILPLADDVRVSVDKGEDLVPKKRTEIEWPLVGTRCFAWEEHGCEIEPGEDDHFVSDFIIDANTELVTIYSYFKNTKKRKRDIGWGITTVYDVRSGQKQRNEKGDGEHE